MKIRKKVRFNTRPNTWDLGWRNCRPVVRVTFAELALAKRLGISTEDYARSKLQGLRGELTKEMK
jgi:hypothetical protein